MKTIEKLEAKDIDNIINLIIDNYWNIINEISIWNKEIIINLK